MESNEDNETIDSKYNIITRKGHGATGDVYLVKDIKSNIEYAAKVFREPYEYFKNEVEILNLLKEDEIARQYIANIISSGEGLIITKDLPKVKNQYIVFEYMSKGDLIDYIYYPKRCFSELHNKYIFYKILKEVETIHKTGICHRDLKLENILVDNNFDLKICDFGFATKNDHLLKEYLGTEKYAAPELFIKKPYDGFKADIFSLGVILFALNSGKHAFENATKYDKKYLFIIRSLLNKNNINLFWNEIYKEYPSLSISDELKDLFVRMVSFRAKDRPIFQEIFNSEWMKEIRDMKEEQLDKLESDVKQEFATREPEVKDGRKKEMETNNQNNNTETSSGNRTINDEKDLINPDIKPNYAKTGLNMEYYIKINGKMNPNKFMNELISEIKNNYKKDCDIEPSKTEIKFRFYLETKNDEYDDIPDDIKEELKSLGIDDEENEEEDNIKGKMMAIEIKLFESYNGGYLLSFEKIEGSKNDFLDNIKTISSLVQKII